MMQFFCPMHPPRTTHQTQAVRVVNGKPRFYAPPELQQARAQLSSHLAEHRPDEPYEGGVRVTVKWLFATKDRKQHGKYKTTRPDAHNLNKLLFDCMTDLGFWTDDAQVASEIIEKFWTIETPGIFINIERIA
jgi:Holliday junction resolvase RusA-like endonuclease